jgi:hypothetical protein
VRPPTGRNIYKALGFLYIVGATPVIVLICVAYWAYGNGVSEYLLYSTSGPTWLVTVANVAAFLQVLVTIHVSIYLCSSNSSLVFQAPHEALTHLMRFCSIIEYASSEMLKCR